MTEPLTLHCSRCGADKPADEFAPRPDCKRGRQYLCIKCNLEANAIYRWKLLQKMHAIGLVKPRKRRTAVRAELAASDPKSAEGLSLIASGTAE